MVAKAVNAISLPFIEVGGAGPILRETLDAFDLVRHEPPHSTLGIPDVVTRPVSARVARRLGVDAVCDALYERSFDRISKDCLKEGGRFLFILSTLLRIPVAAFWLKKYFSGTS